MIHLRELRLDEMPQLIAWRNAIYETGLLRQDKLLTMQDQIEWFERMRKSATDRMFAITNDVDVAALTNPVDGRIITPARVDAALIGVCGICYIDWRNRSGEISIYIGNDAERRSGFGYTALTQLCELGFERFNLHRLWAEIYDHNNGSVALFEKVGFKHEGRSRDTFWWNGKYCDSIRMSLLDTDTRAV